MSQEQNKGSDIFNDGPHGVPEVEIREPRFRIIKTNGVVVIPTDEDLLKELEQATICIQLDRKVLIKGGMFSIEFN